MKRVLQIYGEILSNGGQEAYSMNMYRNINREKVQFDFYTPYYCDNEKLVKEIEQLGGKVYTGGGKFELEGNKKDFVKNLSEFLSNNPYEIVHINSGSIFALAFGAKIAKKHGAKKIIVHSHCTGNDNIKYRIIKAISSGIFLRNATYYCACSKEAASWKFPKSIIKKEKYDIIKNGIELDKFKFSKRIRDEYRKQLDLENQFVIAHVGRFTDQKNHEFLINVFEELKNRCKNCKLLLIGDGPNKEKIITMLNEKNLKNSVSFLGIRNDVNKILQAADMFIFPSRFEGLGIVAIEAQATGLPTLCSENVPEEANQTDLFNKLNLFDGIDTWINKIIELKDKKYENTREDYTEKLRLAGYDAKDSAKRLEDIYLKG